MSNSSQRVAPAPSVIPGIGMSYPERPDDSIIVSGNYNMPYNLEQVMLTDGVRDGIIPPVGTIDAFIYDYNNPHPTTVSQPVKPTPVVVTPVKPTTTTIPIPPVATTGTNTNTNPAVTGTVQPTTQEPAVTNTDNVNPSTSETTNPADTKNTLIGLAVIALIGVAGIYLYRKSKGK